MEAQGRGTGSRRSRDDRARGARGAALTEYALLLTFIVLVSVVAIQALETGASEEVDDQNTCIEKRPPDPSCQIPVLPTTTAPGGPTTTDTTIVSPTLPQSGDATFSDVTATDNGDGTWKVEVTVEVQDDAGSLEGVVIEVEFRMAGFPDVFPGSGVTDSNGQTQPPIVFDVPFPTATSVEVTVKSGTPKLTSTPPPTVVDNPLLP